MTDISLKEAADRAWEAEILCLMMKRNPGQLDEPETEAMMRLLARLIGNVANRLGDEVELQGGSRGA